MGDRIKLIRRATERARELQASGGAPKMKNDKIEHDSASAADFLSEDNRMAAPIVQTLTDSRGISTSAAFYDTFLAHGRKVRFGKPHARIAPCFALQNRAMPFSHANQSLPNFFNDASSRGTCCSAVWYTCPKVNPEPSEP